MKILPVKGDIADVAPRVAELAVLWIRGGFNQRAATWQFRIHKAYPTMRRADGETIPDQPWLSPTDQAFLILPADGRLRHLYLFSNPSNSRGLRDLAEVRAAVARSLNHARSIGVRRLAMILIPFAPAGEKPTREQNKESAAAIVAELRRWDTANPSTITHVHLVDLGGGFEDCLPPAAEQSETTGSAANESKGN